MSESRKHFTGSATNVMGDDTDHPTGQLEISETYQVKILTM